jgi:hypothetical protein
MLRPEKARSHIDCIQDAPPPLIIGRISVSHGLARGEPARE